MNNPDFIGVPLDEVLKSKVVAIDCYLSSIGDVPVIEISALILKDGTRVFVEGEHDCPYIPIADKSVLPQVVRQLARQSAKENEDESIIDDVENELR